MREIRPSGSEGGVGRKPHPDPYRQRPHCEEWNLAEGNAGGCEFWGAGRLWSLWAWVNPGLAGRSEQPGSAEHW